MKRSFFLKCSLLFCALFLAPVLQHAVLLAETSSVLRGKVSDADNLPVEGARIFVYDSAESRRSANFISAPTAGDGQFRLVLSPGRYWVVARLKKTEGYGPLLAGDKNSGEAGEIEIGPGQELTRDFLVADLKDARKLRTKDKDGMRLIRISGRILDKSGAPVVNSYAFANRNETFSGVPDHVSTWVDEKGNFVLTIPPGAYFLGGAWSFPPGKKYFMQGPITVDADRTGLDLMKK